MTLGHTQRAQTCAGASYFVNQLRVRQLAFEVPDCWKRRDVSRLIHDVIKDIRTGRRRLTRCQLVAPRSSLPGSSPVATPFSNVTDPRLIV